MEILLENPLATMYGPYFLVFFGFVITFTLIILGINKTRLDQTDNLGLPPIPSEIDPYEIAYLRGGTNEVARAVIFSLMQKGYLEIGKDGSDAYLSRTKNQPGSSRLMPIEQVSLDWIRNRQETKHIFESNGLTKQLEAYGETYKARLEQQQMLASNEMRSQMLRRSLIAVALIGGLGVYKIIAAVAHGSFNFAGIIIMSIIGIIIAGVIANLPRVTKLGKAHLERLQLAFENLKLEAQKGYVRAGMPQTAPQTTFAGVDPLLLSVGVFGGGILVGTIFDDYNQMFQKAQNQTANSSSCGSSCGSCSSSDGGGSSCGSGCGGGCGGCGG